MFAHMVCFVLRIHDVLICGVNKAKTVWDLVPQNIKSLKKTLNALKTQITSWYLN